MKIPKYKRDRFVFVSNLKEVTADPMNPTTLLRDAYLLSEAYQSESAVERAAMVRQRRNLLISDNGNFTRMKQIAAGFADQGSLLLETGGKERDQYGRISAHTLEQRKELMADIAAACQTELDSLDIARITARQDLIRPHYMIGMEDFTIPVLMLCGLMDPVFNPDCKEVLEFQSRTIDVYKKQRDGVFNADGIPSDAANFLVAHAYDYASAFQAGENSHAHDKDGIAISYGAPMKSRRWITHLDIGGITEPFDEKLPESYLIAQTITLGVINGHPGDVPYHILGLGSPILVALVGYQLRHSKAVSIDSTAPFKDAYAGKIYGRRNAFIKMDMYRLAAWHLVNNRPYKSISPFWHMFNQQFPSKWQPLRDHFNVTPSTDIRQLAKKLKNNPDLLEKNIPFFATARSGKDDLMHLLRIARSGHNFWVLQSICRNINKHRDKPEQLKSWMGKKIQQYTNVAHPKWAKAVRTAFQLTEKYRNYR